jgi:hypothetical protein
MVGTNGKYFISNGTNYVHVYAKSSTGAIGKAVSKIDTALYSGAECGTTGPSVLDHTRLDLTQPISQIMNRAAELEWKQFQLAHQHRGFGPAPGRYEYDPIHPRAIIRYS